MLLNTAQQYVAYLFDMNSENSVGYIILRSSNFELSQCQFQTWAIWAFW